MGAARRGRPRGRTRLVAVVCAALAVAACGASGASLPPAPSGVPSLRDMVPEEVEGLPVDPGTKPIAKGSYRWGANEYAWDDPGWSDSAEGELWGLATGIETIWDPDLGVIILGPEETGTVVSQLVLDVIPSSEGRLRIRGATLSWTARRVGTLDRGEAELFELVDDRSGTIDVEERGPNYLKGRFRVPLQRAAVLIGGAELDERKADLYLEGVFVAVEP